MGAVIPATGSLLAAFFLAGQADLGAEPDEPGQGHFVLRQPREARYLLDEFVVD